jgi:hypothetical protein
MKKLLMLGVILALVGAGIYLIMLMINIEPIESSWLMTLALTAALIIGAVLALKGLFLGRLILLITGAIFVLLDIIWSVSVFGDPVLLANHLQYSLFAVYLDVPLTIYVESALILFAVEDMFILAGGVIVMAFGAESKA